MDNLGGNITLNSWHPSHLLSIFMIKSRNAGKFVVYGQQESSAAYFKREPSWWYFDLACEMYGTTKYWGSDLYMECLCTLIIYALLLLVFNMYNNMYMYFVKVIKHPSKVLEIQMRKEGFRCEAGQVGLHCMKLWYIGSLHKQIISPLLFL